MGSSVVLFLRRYRAALLDYLLGNDETGRAKAYALGRRAIDEGVGLLQILAAHQRALNALLESARTAEESFKTVKAAEEFLMDALSPFEMTYRSFVTSLDHPHDRVRATRPPRMRRRHLEP